MVRNSLVRRNYDAASSALLKASAAVTSTTTQTAIDLGELDGAWWHDGNVTPHGQFIVCVLVSALDTANSDETYTVSLVVDDTSNMGDSPATIASYTITAVGYYEFVVDSATIPVVNSDTSGTSKWLAYKETLGGTTPSITSQAWIADSKGA